MDRGYKSVVLLLTVTVSVIYCPTKGAPVVDTVPTVQGWKGEDIRLPCNFHDEPLFVYWGKVHISNPEQSTGKAFFDGNFVSREERFDIDRNFNLIITDLEVGDEGLYRCELVLQNFQISSNSTLMTVFSPVVYTAPSVRVWTRGNIHLPCHFEEEPLAVFWVKESMSNQQLETRKASFFDGNFASKTERFNIDENYSLIISDVHVEDEGSYYCQLVLGSFEVFLNSTFLSVNSPAVDTLPTIHGWRGEDIRLPCEFHEEPLAVYWVKESMLHPELSTSKAFFDGDYVSMAARFDIDRNFNLIITDLEVADEGLYHCQVVLRNYENFENSTLMTVSSMALTHEIEECVEETQQDPSRCTHQTPSETSYFNLSCVVSGFRPNISMLWTEESGEKLYSVVSQQKTLADNTYERFETITVSAKLGAEQTFKCTATGDSLNGRSTTEITVLPISATIITHGMEECVHENRVNPDRCRPTHQTPSGTSSFNLTCVVSGFMSNISMLWTEESGEVLYPVLSQQTALSSDTYERFETITVSAKLGAEQTFKCTAAGDSLNGRSTTEITVLPISAMIITDGMEECVHENKLNPDRCTHRTPSETSFFNLTCVVSGFKSKISMLWTEESGEMLYPVLSQQTAPSSDTHERFETITVSAKHGMEQTFKCTATGDSLNETSTAEIIVLPLSGKSVNLGLAIGLGMGISVLLVIAFLLVGKYLQKYHPDYLPRKGCGWNPCWRRQHETERSDAEKELIQSTKSIIILYLIVDAEVSEQPDTGKDAISFIDDFCRMVYYQADLAAPIIFVTHKNEYPDVKAVRQVIYSLFRQWYSKPTILMFENYTQANYKEDVEKDIEYLEFLWEALKRCDRTLRYR
ncbi:uncharacterized protein [Diadema antillarum]|uniref:uncharacterized protein n=1 Tax=Diadema antillarum TaxID=105358 RepID=UPI003A8AFAD5